MVLNPYNNKTFAWPQLYERDPDLAAMYQMLGANTALTDFDLHDGLLCHLVHLCIPSSERAKMIWESHYSRMAGNFSVANTVEVLQQHFY
jgi:hypothetical protein